MKSGSKKIPIILVKITDESVKKLIFRIKKTNFEQCDFSVTPIFVFIQRLILSLKLQRKLLDSTSAKPNYLRQIIGQKLPNLDTFASLSSLKLIT